MCKGREKVKQGGIQVKGSNQCNNCQHCKCAIESCTPGPDIMAGARARASRLGRDNGLDVIPGPKCTEPQNLSDQTETPGFKKIQESQLFHSHYEIIAKEKNMMQIIAGDLLPVNNQLLTSFISQWRELIELAYDAIDDYAKRIQLNKKIATFLSKGEPFSCFDFILGVANSRPENQAAVERFMMNKAESLVSLSA